MTPLFQTLTHKENRGIIINLIPLLILLVLGLFVSNQAYYFEYMLPVIGIFYLHTFYLIPKVLGKNSFLKYFISLLFISMGFLCFSIWSSLEHIIHTTYPFTFWEVISSSFPYHPFKREALQTLLAILSISSLYAYIRHLLLKKRMKKLKKIGIYSAALVLLIILSTGIKYYVDTAWKGNATIQFIDNNSYQYLAQILQLPQFKNQVVYVDLWYSSCGPCRAEFKHLPKLKEQLADKSIQYLYLAHDTSVPHDKQLWKNAIKKYDLSGWHFFMPPAFDSNIWKMIGEKTQIPARYPHYLLIEKDGKVSSFDASRPSDASNLHAQIETLL